MIQVLNYLLDVKHVKHPSHLFIYYENGKTLLYHRLIYHNENIDISIPYPSSNEKDVLIIIYSYIAI